MPLGLGLMALSPVIGRSIRAGFPIGGNLPRAMFLIGFIDYMGGDYASNPNER